MQSFYDFLLNAVFMQECSTYVYFFKFICYFFFCLKRKGRQCMEYFRGTRLQIPTCRQKCAHDWKMCTFKLAFKKKKKTYYYWGSQLNGSGFDQHVVLDSISSQLPSPIVFFVEVESIEAAYGVASHMVCFCPLLSFVLHPNT